MRISVVALGKIGLPLAVQYASKGHDVVGVDVNPAVVDAVNAGTAPFPGETGLEEKLAEVVSAGRLRATTDYSEAIPEAEAVVIVVPLFVDEEARPDWTWMDAATTSVGHDARRPARETAGHDRGEARVAGRCDDLMAGILSEQRGDDSVLARSRTEHEDSHRTRLPAANVAS